MYPRGNAAFHPGHYSDGADVVARLQRQIIAERRAAGDEIARLRAALQEKEATLRVALAELDASRQDAAAARQALAEQEALCKEALCKEPADVEALGDARRKLHRLAADMANLRRRQGEEQDRARTEARAGLLREFVEILDGMERALASSADTDSPWHQGSEALKRQMEQLLERAGVERLGEAGEPFDPRIHEAVGTTVHCAQPAEHIAATVQAGYRFADGGLIRPARVVVSAR
jgi:molecular chaperone GrpE